MDKKRVIDIIHNFKTILEKENICDPKIILFGSHFEGTQRDDSDIDLIIISESFKGMDFWKRQEILVDAISEIFEPIEAFAVTPEEWENEDYTIISYAKKGQYY